MVVLQIYNHVPDALKVCVESVKAFAKKVKAEYIVISDKSDDTFYFKSAWSDLQRIKYAAQTKNLLYADWDILLKKSFTVNSDIPIFGNDCDSFFYTSDDNTFFIKVLKEYEKYLLDNKSGVLEHARLYKIMKKYKKIKKLFNPKTYTHLHYNKKSFNINKNKKALEIYNERKEK